MGNVIYIKEWLRQRELKRINERMNSKYHEALKKQKSDKDKDQGA